jgi:hypothetical protein
MCNVERTIMCFFILALVEYIREKDQEISAEQDKYQGIKNIASKEQL